MFHCPHDDDDMFILGEYDDVNSQWRNTLHLGGCPEPASASHGQAPSVGCGHRSQNASFKAKAKQYKLS